MDPLVKLYLERADTEIVEAESLFKISGDNSLKAILKIDVSKTFYSGVISHSYYAIFYSAKAYLLSKGITISSPREHQKVYLAFSKLVNEKTINKELFNIYDKEFLKAEVLLEILEGELGKRTKFTYKTLPQANKEPAFESTENANKFYKAINALLG